MTTAIKMITNKNKNNNKLITTPFFSNQTTANTTNKNTLIANSRNENININNFDYSDKENISPNLNIAKDNTNTNTKSKILCFHKNSSRNTPLRHLIKQNLSRTNENSYNSKKNISSRSKGFNSYRSNHDSKKNNKMNNLKDKNKDGFIFLDKILNHNHINSPSRKNIYNLRNKYILITEESKKSLSKDKTKEKKKRKIDNNLLNKKKDLNIISYDNQRNNLNLFNKNTISRNYNNKISSSVKRNNNMKSITNNNMKSISNPINKSHIDKNIYLKKK